MSTLAQIAQFVRWRDWGPGKLTVFLGLCLYIAVTYELSFDSFVPTFLVFLIFAAAQCMLGYLLNDWSDQKLDRRQLKQNGFNGKSDLERGLSLTLVVFAAIVSGLPLILRPGFALLWLTWAAATAAYSLEPLRFKNHGALGLAVAFVAQWFLPVLITFAAFQVNIGWDMWVLAGALTISGAAREIGRQRSSRTRQIATRSSTFAAGIRDQQLDFIYALALFFDKLAIGVVVAVIAHSLLGLNAAWAPAMAIFLCASYAVLFIVTLGDSYRALRRIELEDPYFGADDNMGHRFGLPGKNALLHQNLLNFIMPLVVGTAATLRSPYFGLVLGVLLVCRVLLNGMDWVWPLRSQRVRTK